MTVNNGMRIIDLAHRDKDIFDDLSVCENQHASYAKT